ncbi:MAG: hypothetical protein ANABAC_2499 [Anaerolineae bacterium]|nr:MAG: hypothetical protein ANABAC_2499 [Anaerolineae bacterium]
MGVLLLPLWLVNACSGFQTNDVSSLEEVYLPPSPIATAISPSALFQTPLFPTPTIACTNSLLFIADQTIPDGTEVEPGAVLNKVWEVENNGTCNFDDRYRLKLIGGSELGASPEQALYPARSGTRFLLHIRFIAPSESGLVRSAWQAFDPQGDPFGDPIYLEVVVK